MKPGYYLATTRDPVRWALLAVTQTGACHLLEEGPRQRMVDALEVLAHPEESQGRRRAERTEVESPLLPTSGLVRSSPGPTKARLRLARGS